MPQNRNKLMKHLVGHLANAVTHRILQEAIEEDSLRNYYGKEAAHALEKAIEYRRGINPSVLSPEEADALKQRIAQNVRNELQKRQERGYTGIDFSRIATVMDELLAQVVVR